LPENVRNFHDNCPKNMFSQILGGHVPPLPPVSYAYESTYEYTINRRKKQHICSAIDKQIKTIKQKPRITKLMSNAISSPKKKNQLQTLTFTQTGYCLAFMISKQLAKLFVTQPISNRPSESQHYTQNRVNKPNTTKHAMCSGQTILL